jgi:vancomycin resistance protein YoaR
LGHRGRSALTGLVVLLVVGVAQGLMAGRMAPGVRIGGVSVGFKTRAAAAAALKAAARQRGVMTARLATRKGPITVALSDLGLSVDMTATLHAAASEGHAHIGPASIWLWSGGAVQPVVRFDTARYLVGVSRLQATIDVPARDATLVLRGHVVGVVPSVAGATLDEVALKRLLADSLAHWRRYSGAIPIQTVTPAVTTADALQRADVAGTYVSRPLTLRFRDAAVVLSPADIARMLAVNKGADASTHPLTFDNPRAARRLHQLFAFVERAAVPARVVVRASGGIVLTTSRDGLALDMPRLVGDLDAAAAGGGLRDVFVAVMTVPAHPTTHELQAAGLSALGSQFTTFFDPANTARAANISQAAKLVDATIVPPRAVFSLNDTTGPRTLNRGFDIAPVIAADGVLRPGVGGGVCQFATTLFNAVFFAGLPVVERRPHIFYLDHYPVGRDATVSWGGADLKFRNDTSRPLMIRCWTSGGSVTVVLVGTIGRSVDYTTGAFYDVRAPRSTRKHPRIIYDDTVSRGIVSWEPGEDGRSVRVTRTVKVGSGVLFRDTFVSVYQPMDWIERIGTR